jgi:hypothetical protein
VNNKCSFYGVLEIFDDKTRNLQKRKKERREGRKQKGEKNVIH